MGHMKIDRFSGSRPEAIVFVELAPAAPEPAPAAAELAFAAPEPAPAEPEPAPGAPELAPAAPELAPAAPEPAPAAPELAFAMPEPGKHAGNDLRCNWFESFMHHCAVNLRGFCCKRDVSR